jgi:hypothetical protein
MLDRTSQARPRLSKTCVVQTLSVSVSPVFVLPIAGVMVVVHPTSPTI